jgi:transcriptional regulator with XRE-family HTH domain
MFGLTKKEKLEFVLEQIKKKQLTAYEIGKKTKLSVSGIDKIINGESKNPQENTLNKIILYLEELQLGSGLKNLKEPEPDYFLQPNKEDDLRKLFECEKEKNVLTHEIVKLQSILRERKIPFNDFFKK